MGQAGTCLVFHVYGVCKFCIQKNPITKKHIDECVATDFTKSIRKLLHILFSTYDLLLLVSFYFRLIYIA